MKWSCATGTDVMPPDVAVTSTVPLPGGAVALQVVEDVHMTELAVVDPKAIVVDPFVVNP